MGALKFLSWPAGWRNALPGAVLMPILVAAAVSAAQGIQSGWHSLDLIFWIRPGGLLSHRCHFVHRLRGTS